MIPLTLSVRSFTGFISESLFGFISPPLLLFRTSAFSIISVNEKYLVIGTIVIHEKTEKTSWN